MYAPSPRPQPASPRPRRRQPRPRQPEVLREIALQTKVCEVGVRLMANGLLATVAGLSLVHLVPYLQTQSQQLQYVNAEVTKAEQTTSRLRADFGRYFDPSQTQNLIQEQSGYKRPAERQIVWTDPNPPANPTAP